MIACPKCGQEHEPTGLHEEDSGQWECEVCQFRFIVLVEYDPCYTSSCVTHEYGPWSWRTTTGGNQELCRFCQHCGVCQLQGQAD